MIIVHNTQTQELDVYGSMKAAADATGVKVEKLYYAFSQAKKTQITIHPFQFKRAEVTRSKHSK